MVRAIKNRFGPVDEVGCFDLAADGITAVADPTGLFVENLHGRVAGTCVAVTMEGRRPLLAEVQALVTPSPLERPRRTTSGLDASRIAMVLAVLQQHCGIRLHGHDVFASTVGGAQLSEPASDLAGRGGARLGHVRHARSPVGVVAMGEIGLAGELRRVRDLPQRMAEAARLGFRMAVVPADRPASRGPRRARATARSTACAWSRLPTSPPRCGCSGSSAGEARPERRRGPLDPDWRRQVRHAATGRRPRGRVAGTDRTEETLRLRETLASIAPGTALRDGLERILRGRTGALIVLGHDRVVESISTGGFTLDVPFTATGLRELAKMDGGIIVDRDITRIIRAAVHLMPDHTIPSEETGTRHRTAERVAKQTGFPVISVSQSMQIIAAYVGETRHVLEDSGQILSRANQALATLERYKLRLDEVASTLSALEIEDLVTVRDVAVVAQRLEMVTRIAREIEDYVLELGTDGRLLSLQLEELVTGVDTERELVIRDYVPTGRRRQDPEALLARLEALSATELVDPASAARALGIGSGRAPRRGGDPARLPAAGQGAAAPRAGRRPARRTLRHPAEAALGRGRRPAGRRGRRRAARPQRARGPVPAGRVDAFSSATSERLVPAARALPGVVRVRLVVRLVGRLRRLGDHLRIGAVSRNCTSTGSPPRGATATW